MYSFPEIGKLFRAYREAEEKREKPSLRALGKVIGMNPGHVSKLLRRLDLKPFYGQRHPGTRQETKEKKERVYRGLKTSLPVRDIAYFVGLSTFSVHQIFSEQGISSSERQPIERFQTLERRYTLTPRRYTLTRRRASQIYEEMDQKDLTPAEIAFCLDLPGIMMIYALENRKEGKKIEKEIVHALRKMYPEEKISRPYRQ